MGSSRTKSRANTERQPTAQSLTEARRVVQNWEREHTHNERLVVLVAEALDKVRSSPVVRC